MTNEVAVYRIVQCECCGDTWTSKHSRGPLLCAPCFHSLSAMWSGQVYSTCRLHSKTINAFKVSPPATLTNGAYVPLVAR